MTWKRRPDGSLLYVIGDHKAGPHAQGDIYIEEADLRRLAACWNACAGVSTENLEDNLPFIELAKNYNAVIHQRDIASGELGEIRAAINASPEESTADAVTDLPAGDKQGSAL
jgi:hypothetical protein